MHHRWAPAFTIVELIISIVVIAILVAITVVAYTGVTKLAVSTAAQSDLQALATTMQRSLQNNDVYPDTIPRDFEASNRVNVSLVRSGTYPVYETLSPAQKGVLLASVCQSLVDTGVGKGLSQGGDVREYITGCGNWNNNSMQITGWQSRVWPTPVEKQPLLDYAQSFTATGWDADQQRVVRLFYTSLIQQYEMQGGTFPVTSFWDYWATPSNGGVIKPDLPTDATSKPMFCAEATVANYPELVWHITQKDKVTAGPC